MVKTEDEVSLLSRGDGYSSVDKIEHLQDAQIRRRRYLLLTVIFVSSVLNVLQSFWITIDSTWLKQHISVTPEHESTPIPDQRITWPETSRVIYKPLYPKSLYETIGDSKATDELLGSFDPDLGVITLPAGQMNMLQSEKFPWDSTKEIFVLQGYHSLQSVQVIWQTLRKLQPDKPLASHVLHSLNVLWEDVLCQADMTPRSVSHKILSNRRMIEAAGQTRRCRSWTDVEDMRIENSACFKDLGAAKHKTPMIEEWQFCPADSPYREVVDEYVASTGGK